MRTNGNEPDFSVEENNEFNGLAKREYFAALAMQGILSAGLTSIENTVAQAAITHADALIEALNKEES